MRIGIAEDVALLREGITALLEQHGHTVLWSVGDASELLARMHNPAPEVTPELLIVDVRMPPENTDDGLRAAVEIRRQNPELAIMILSQHLGNEYAKELLATAPDSGGGTGYLLKERVGRVADFLNAIDVLGHGGVSIDPKVVAALLASHSTGGILATLTNRERDTLALMAEGHTNEQITKFLHLSAPTIERHISSIFTKLDLSEHPGNKRVLAVLEYLKG
ncbi:two-component system response regulator [Microbacterium esteraromaticum]|uniref:Two-component system response regulator n=1 Tax=Microbacterium esteraromaticum TaxID=57043 RepID=A0A1R4I6V1_9MICO|nr:response regulator transcription factor [Microbacterium esteraromaticum]SJN15611.1 two-component system response regulator [Microbacterium esteraromaticum]